MRTKMIKKVLKNGVKLYLYVDKSMKRTVVSYGVNYGSSGIYSNFYLNGVLHHVEPGCAHFLEHLLLEHSKFGNLYTKFASRKYSKNGITSRHYTRYYFIGIENIKESIKELIEAIQDPVFTHEDILKTSEAIISETRLSQDNINRTSISIVDRNLYDGIDLIDNTLCSIGNVETTKKIDYEMLMNCFKAFYSDDNKILVIGGNINPKEMTEYIENIYDNLPVHKNNLKKYNYELGNIRKKEQIEYRSVEDDEILLGFRNNNIKNFSNLEIYYYSYFILDNKFSFGTDTYEKLKKNKVITGGLGWNTSINELGLHIYFRTSSKLSKKFISIIKKELKTKNFSEEDFNIFKKKMIAREAFSIDSKYDVLVTFISGLYISDNFEDIDFVKKLSYKKALDFYDSLDFSQYTLAIIRKKEDN